MPKASEIRAAVTPQRFALRTCEVECRPCGRVHVFTPGSVDFGSREFVDFAHDHLKRCHAWTPPAAVPSPDDAAPVYL